jgi:acetyltransferase-like isoleucine patch superfamily enzyme
MKSIAATAKLFSNVDIASPCRVGDFVILGAPPEKEPGSETPPQPLSIGPGSHIRSHSILYAGNVIGSRFTTGHSVLVRETNSIGDDVSIGSHSIVEHHAAIGHRVRLHSGVFVPEYSVLEDDSWIGPHAVLTNTRHPRCVNMPRCLEPVTIKSGAKIGANATLLPGVVIGEMALVAAGAVVTKNVPPRMVVAGNPAAIISSIDDLKCPMDHLTSPYPAE